jgi:hypothetical protein
MSIINKKRQSGITLITSLMMLLAMTIISVTAIKISSVDLLVAHNYQQQLSVYQEAETKIRREVSFYRLHDWMMEDKQPPETTKDAMVSKAEVMDLEREYPCKGKSSLANSLGPNSPSCKVFLFSIDANMKGSGAQESHFQGAGKQFPNQSNGSAY